MSITDERLQAVDFTDPYYTNALAFVGVKGIDFKTDKASLKGKTLGAQRATLAGQYLEDELGLIFGLFGASAELSNFKILRAIATYYRDQLYQSALHFLSCRCLHLSDFNGDSDNRNTVDGTCLCTAVVRYKRTILVCDYCVSVEHRCLQRRTVSWCHTSHIKRRTFGMSWLLKTRRIVLPRAFGIALPAYGNEVVLMLKSSVLASTITLLDLTGMARTIQARTYTPVELFTAAGLIYLLMTGVVIGLFRYMENRFNRYQYYKPNVDQLNVDKQ